MAFLMVLSPCISGFTSAGRKSGTEVGEHVASGTPLSSMYRYRVGTSLVSHEQKEVCRETGNALANFPRS